MKVTVLITHLRQGPSREGVSVPVSANKDFTSTTASPTHAQLSVRGYLGYYEGREIQPVY